MSKEFACLLAAALLACSGSNHPASDDSHVRFVEPGPHAVLNGLTDVRVEIAVPESITKYELGIEGREQASFSSATGTLALDTTSLPNGETTLVVKATGSSGKQWSDSVSVTINNAAHQLVSYSASAETYAKGEQILLDLTYPLAGLVVSADFTKLDDHFDASGVSVADRGSGHYQLTYTISSEDAVEPGQYSATLIATNAAQQAVITPIEIKLRERPRLPLEIPGATFVDDDSEPVVVTGDSAAPAIQSVTGATQVFSGMPATIDVQWSQSVDNPADRIVVRSPSYSGYLVVPIEDASSGFATLPLQLSPGSSANSTQQALDLLLSAIDATGATNNWSATSLAPYVLESFGTLVTLWWDNAMDLDLEVTTPQGNTIGYGQRSADGGTLEIDSNAMCRLDYINTERTSWPMGAATTGTYTVSARLYDACGQMQANYHVLISACGRLQEYAGSFSATDLGTSHALQEVGAFEVDCARRTHGSVTYRHGNALNGAELIAVEYVPVRAVTGSGASLTIWGEGTTNDRGQFDFYLQPTTPDDYEIEVESSWTLSEAASPLAQVVTQPGNTLHHARFPGNLAAESQRGGLQLVLGDDTAGAFNILDKLRRGYVWVRGHLSAADSTKVKPIKAHWSQGTAAPEAKGGGSYYDGHDNIYMGGLPSDRGEFDDPVVCHEFMHHVTQHIMGEGPGGDHSFSDRITPALAWNEGLATALGQQSLGSPVYYDVNDTWVAFINLEEHFQVDREFAYADRGTSNGKASGNVGEVLVAMVLWDLLDPVGGLADMADTIEATYVQTLGSITRHLPRKSRPNRGAGGIDLVDFLDGWRCQWPALSQRDPELHLLLADRLFPYDFSSSTQCK